MSEIWKSVTGFEDKYEISNLGGVRNKNTGRALSVGKIKGILGVQFSSKEGTKSWHSLHQIVAKEFVPNPNECRFVKHLDGNKENNIASNLVWVRASSQKLPERNTEAIQTNGSVIKDSDNRTEFETGAVRDAQEGKGRFDLMPLDIVSELLKSETVSLVNSSKKCGVDCLYNAISVFAKERKFEGGWSNTERTYLPNAIIEVAKYLEDYAKKYNPSDWKEGVLVSRYIDNALRHYCKYKAGWTDEPHDRAFVWNLMCCIWTIKNKPEMDDWTEEVVER